MTRQRYAIPAAMLIAVLTGSAAAQPKSAKNQPEASNPLRDRDAERLLKVGRELIEAKRYKSAIVLLELLLHPEKPRLFISPTGRHEGQFLTVKREAARLLALLPAEAQATYRKRNDDAARRLLYSYRIKGPRLPSRVAVATRYPLTTAGIEAEYKLCEAQSKDAQPLPAALGLSRLLKSPEAHKHYGALLVLETALAWVRAGQHVRAIEVLEQLRTSTKSGVIHVPPYKIKLYRKRSEALSWLIKTLAPWRSFAGIKKEAWTKPAKKVKASSADANAVILGKPRWMKQNILIDDHGDEHRRRAQVAQRRLGELQVEWRKSGRLMFPVARPRINGKHVLLRTGGRIGAFDLKTGALEWRTFHCDSAYSYLIEQGDRIPAGLSVRDSKSKYLDDYLTQRAWLDVAASRVGLKGGMHVWLVTDVVRSSIALTFRRAGRAPEFHNSLFGTNNVTGQIQWHVGGPARGSAPLAGYYFLTAPTTIGNRLVGLAERDGRIVLVFLRNETHRFNKRQADGTVDPNVFRTVVRIKLETSIPLFKPDWPIDEDSIRRFAGDRPIDAAGLIICPITNEGVIAVDPRRKQLVWAYRYRSRSFTAKSRPPVPEGVFPPRLKGTGQLRNDDMRDRWVDSLPRFVDGKLLLTPRDSDELHCLDPATGKPIWKVPRGDGLYIAEVVDGRVIVVASTEVRSYRLSDGKPGWRLPLFTSMPAGHGLRAGRFYRLPLQTGEVLSFELATGVPIARIAVPGKAGLGNLAGTDTVVSQNALHTVAFSRARDVLGNAIDTLENKPNDPEALLVRASYRMQTGRTDAGIADLRRVVKAKPGKETRSILGSALMMKLRRDFAKSEKLIPEIERLLTTDQDRLQLQSLLTVEYTHRRQHAKAIRSILLMADAKPKLRIYLRSRNNGRVRLDRWLRGRVEALFAKLTADERKAFDQTLRARAKQVIASKNQTRMRRFISVFAKHPAAHRVRFALAEMTRSK